MKIPNILTSLRILLIPVYVVIFQLNAAWAPWLAGAVFGLAAITDWADGYLARKLNQQTPFGAFLDPVADKLMVVVAMVLIVVEYNHLAVTVAGLIIIGRELIISALREWMASLGKRSQVAVSYIGKVKTTFQMIALIVLTVAPGIEWLTLVGQVTLYAAALLTFWSMMQYLVAAWPELKQDL